MPPLSVVRSANAAFSASYRPTALFVGGTSGVGEGTASAFARATKGKSPWNAHILICGRSKESAERIITSFPKTEKSQYEFIQCDVSLMKNVVQTTTDIKSRISTLNYLVVSQGAFSLQGFNPTSEGLDMKMALHFYSRWKFVDELMPCLEKAIAEGQEARVMSILHPGSNAPIDVDDLGLKKNFTVTRAAKQAPTYNDNFAKEYAERHPNTSFIHISPGAVNTGLARDLRWSLRLLLTAVTPLFYPFLTSIRDCGEWMASALISPEFKLGAFYLDSRGDPIPTTQIRTDDDVARAKLVRHYSKEVSVA